MFPGPSRQTPREPDLGNPYRVDLGTAMFGKGTVDHEIGAGNKHRGDRAVIDEMTNKYDSAVKKHEIAMKNVQDTQVELDRYREQLTQIKSAHEHSVNAEIERHDAEALTRKKANDADVAYKKMKSQMAELHKTGAGLKG